MSEMIFNNKNDLKLVGWLGFNGTFNTE